MTRNDNIHRKDGAEMSGRKFPFYDAADGSLDPLFTSKLQVEAQMGCLRGVVLGEEVGDDVMVTWLPNNKRLDSLTFRKELYELIGELQSGEMLGSLPAMIAFCQAHPEARMSDRQTFYAFRLDSSKYRYHLRLFPDKIHDFRVRTCFFQFFIRDFSLNSEQDIVAYRSCKQCTFLCYI